jgi:NTE family protein
MRRLAIVLSGGGAKGAFQVGVLDALITGRGVRPAIVVGTSTGAIQALAVAQQDVPGLVRAWLALRRNRDIYRERGGIAGAVLLGEKGLYDAAPLGGCSAPSPIPPGSPPRRSTCGWASSACNPASSG